MPGTPATQLAEGLAYEFVFFGDILNRFFIENMPVCPLRHGFLLPVLLVFHLSGLYFHPEDYDTMTIESL
jgi:hypothetical protein